MAAKPVPVRKPAPVAAKSAPVRKPAPSPVAPAPAALPDLAGIGVANWNAFVAAGGIVLGGFGELTRALAEFNRAALDARLAAGQTLLGARGPVEAFDVQARLALDGVGRLTAGQERLASLAARIAGEAAASLGASARARAATGRRQA